MEARAPVYPSEAGQARPVLVCTGVPLGERGHRGRRADPLDSAFSSFSYGVKRKETW